TVGAALVMPGLTAWQGLFEHGRLQAGQSVLVHGAAGVVGSMATQLAREAGAYVIGTGRASGRQTALDCGAQEFVDLDNDALEDVGGVDLVFDVLGGDVAKRSAGVIRAGGTLVTIAGPTEARPADGRTVDFVVVPDRAQLSEIVRRARDGRVRTNIGTVAALDDAVAAFNPTERIKGKTIIRVRPGGLGESELNSVASANAVRLQLHALAYNLGNFLRTLATPEPIKDWSLTSLKDKLIKIGAKVVSHGRYVIFQMAEVAIARQMFQKILRLIAELRSQPP